MFNMAVNVFFQLRQPALPVSTAHVKLCYVKHM